MYSVAARQRTLTFIHLTFGVAEKEQERGCVLILYLFIGVLIQNRDDTRSVLTHASHEMVFRPMLCIGVLL